MKKLKKKLKGMTLIECIVAIAVAGIAGMIMCQIGAVVHNLMINTNHVNNKTNVEAPTAKVQDHSVLTAAGTEQTVKVTCGTNSENVKVVKYSTDELVPTDAEGNVEDKYQVNLDSDLEFYVLATETTPTT